jgi:hypothetical protein
MRNVILRAHYGIPIFRTTVGIRRLNLILLISAAVRSQIPDICRLLLLIHRGIALNIFTDTVLAIIPASIVYTLHMDTRKRTSLVIILSLGILAAICGIVKTTYLPSLSAHSDITWNTYNLIAWAGSELFVLIFCGSMPPLRPLWDSFGPKALRLRSSGYYNKGSGSSGNASNNPLSQYIRHGVGEGEFSPLRDDRIHVSTDIEIGSVSSVKPLK